jgi:hypothetical protein
LTALAGNNPGILASVSLGTFFIASTYIADWFAHFCLIWIILQVGGMASGLASGVSMAAMRIRYLISPVTSGLIVAKDAASMTNPVRTRRDRESGMMTTARQANHLVAGNTM